MITGRCNLNCKYCFYGNERRDLKDLTIDCWLSFFDELGKLGVMEVWLSGGEPFMREDLFDIIDRIIANRMRYRILSNGTLVDDRILKQFEVGNRLRRLNDIQISIDGSRPEIHNKTRPNSFNSAMRGLRLLKDAGVPVSVRVTINRHNVEDLENIALLLLEDLDLPTFTTNEVMPIGSGYRNVEDISLSKSDMVKAMHTMEFLFNNYCGRIVANAGPLFKVKAYSNMEFLRRKGLISERGELGYLSACCCVFTSLDILHDGKIVPCCMLPSLILGNITNDSLEKIWLFHPWINLLRERRTIPMITVEGCEDCEWAQYCNGGCPAYIHQLTGELKRANPLDCYRNFLFRAKPNELQH